MLDSDDAVICGNGRTCVITFQASEIKQGQRLFTNSGCAAMGYGFPAALGVCDGNGVSIPDFGKVAYAFDIPYVKIDKEEDIGKVITELLDSEGPCMCEVFVDEKQNFEPKLSSKVLPDGRIVSPEPDDMCPFLSREEYESNKIRD
ncbi:MAG: hypothetical protein K6G69_02500 [Lachnospiraceae bacterium]|nr:hypothetical protein [Lachnospiraceae bacterium]